MKLAWTPRQRPLPIAGVVALGEVVERLLAKLRQRPAAEELSGVKFPQGLLLLGPGESLPWADGVFYLGRLGQLYLPTHLDPGLPAEWLIQGLENRVPAPWALLPDGRVIGLGAASAIGNYAHTPL